MEPNRRDVAILEYLSDVNLALPPKVLYYNMKVDREITFSERTLKRRLKLLMEEELVDRVDGTDGYYQIAPDGKEYVEQRRNGY
jgi:DNA-binding HxlR family transcriptional regulator